MAFKIAEIAVLALAAGIVQTVTGFGNAIVMMLGFPSIFGITTAASISGSIGLANNASLTFTYRKHIDTKKTAIITAIYSIISIFSIKLTRDLNVNSLGLIYGIFLVLLALYFIFLNGKVSLHGPFWLIFSALISGIGNGLFSIGGPLLAVYYSHLFEKREEYLGNIQFSFFVCGLISLITRIINGLYTTDLIKYSIVGIVFIYLGQLIGMKISNNLNPKVIRICMYALVLFAGIMTIIKYIHI